MEAEAVEKHVADYRAGFRRWRRGRPFWGGLFLVLSGLELFLSANMALADLKVHIGPQGFLSYLLPVLMVVCGALTWFSPAQRLFYGIVGTLTALYSFIGLNLGGWFVGMLLGILGGALVIAWAVPGPLAAGSDAVPVAGGDAGSDAGGDAGSDAGGDARFAAASDTGFAAGGDDHGAAAGDDPGEPTVPIRPAAGDPGIAPGMRSGPELSGRSGAEAGSADPGPPNGPPWRPLHRKALILIAPLALATTIVGSAGMPADAAECPEGLPSRTVTSAPRTSSAKPGATTPTTGRPSPATSKAEEIPCLGARQQGLVAEAGGIPRAGVRPGLLKTASLTMYQSSYDGVAEVPTANGPIRSLRFTMDKAVNKPFSLEIAEPNGATTLIRSRELTTDGNVEFYSPKFTGKLFGLIPVTFTPEQPPPLTLPVLWFTDVSIDLAYVRCDVLTAEPLSITEV